MGTRSRIGYKQENGQVISAYCHWDGYPSHNGKILLENYNTLEAVQNLVAPGDMSSLNPKCDKPEGHPFEKPVDGYTVYYGRDRGEKNVTPRMDENEDAFVADSEEYSYLFKGGKWHVSDHGAALRRLTKALVNSET